jgi:DNA-binding transcriptional MerR regulator
MTMAEGKYTLAQLSELTELPQRKVRYYLHEHLVPSPEAKGKGRFGDEQLAALLAVKSLRDAGLSLDAIKDYLGVGGDDAGEQKAPGAGVIAEIVAVLKAGADRLQPARLREVTDSILGVGPTLFSKVLSGLGRRAKPQVERMQSSTWERIPVTSQVEFHVKRPLSRRQDRALEQLMERAEELFSEDDG